jgi:hypothetical protein
LPKLVHTGKAARFAGQPGLPDRVARNLYPDRDKLEYFGPVAHY